MCECDIWWLSVWFNVSFINTSKNILKEKCEFGKKYRQNLPPPRKNFGKGSIIYWGYFHLVRLFFSLSMIPVILIMWLKLHFFPFVGSVTVTFDIPLHSPLNIKIDFLFYWESLSSRYSAVCHIVEFFYVVKLPIHWQRKRSQS